LFLEAEDPEKDISLYINSPGGSSYAGMAIYDAMQYVRPDVQTICTGMGMSAAAMILSGGARGKRYALPNAKVMIHQGSGGFRGFHAARGPVDALSYARGRDEPGTVCRILGEVVLWGHVVETEAGWRASHAYPARLYVPDAEIAAALAAYSVPVCGSPSSQTCTATPSPSELRS